MRVGESMEASKAGREEAGKLGGGEQGGGGREVNGWNNSCVGERELRKEIRRH